MLVGRDGAFLYFLNAYGAAFEEGLFGDWVPAVWKMSGGCRGDT